VTLEKNRGFSKFSLPEGADGCTPQDDHAYDHHWSSIEAEIPAHGLSSGGLGTLLKIII